MKIGYSCLSDLFHKKLTDLGYLAREFGLHSLRVGGTQLLPMLRYQTGALRDMVNEDLRMPKRAMSRTPWKADWKSLRI